MSNLDINNLFGVKGIVAVVTGGGSGLGLTIAKALDANGAKAVYIIGRRIETLAKAAAQAINGTIIPLQGDVTSKESLAAAAYTIEKEQGYINVLYANSGIIGVSSSDLGLPTDRKPTLKEFKEAHWAPSMADWSQAFHVNVSGVFYTSLAFVELLGAGNTNGNLSQKSSIIVTSSISGFSRVTSAGLAYSTSKAGATHLVKMLATQWTPYGIRVNAIAPGIFPSEMTDDLPMMQGGKDILAEGSVLEGMVPMKRLGREEEIAGTAVFLAGKGGAYLTFGLLRRVIAYTTIFYAK
ncbi:putative Rhamnolipids biosynthesis 3-oxoacyl-reductase [Amylocarpus encephaloides]|uniref:Rhamnolipids biosynthesis 3-oxoacyl-reductase n=1 Tax=Amylocarpus encephaloides TaxID=45428 RepID=A0A9P7YQ79_9HELO|nr:putative Rhamnolipids biosynthesis 3-oxoacyl-reductase [Amylocarpus encephaloides]